MARVVTYEDKGVAKISDFSHGGKSNDEIIKILHEHSYHENLAAEMLKNLSQYSRSEHVDKINKVSLGYAIEQAMKARVHSTITRIEFHNRPLSHFEGVK